MRPMFLTKLADQNEDDRMCFVGEFVRIDGDHVVLRTHNDEIKVEHKGLGSYRSKYTMVVGTMREGLFVEENAYPVEDDFNYDLYKRLARVSAQYSEIV